MGKLIATDIDGIIHELRIKEEDFLLSFFELVINAIQAIEEKGNLSNGQIDIYVEREESDGNVFGRRPISAVRVVDNGIGFTEENYNSFTKSHSTKKVDIGGKGVGRFAVLSVFDNIEISSVRNSNNGSHNQICFSLNREEGLSEPEYSDTLQHVGTTVYASGLVEVFKDCSASYDLESIADSILNHCLLYYLNQAAPTIVLHEGEESISLSSQFSPSDFIDKTYSGRIKQSEFKLYFVKADKPKYHQYILCANNRVVRSKKISTVFPLFTSPLVDDGVIKYLRIYVVSDYLDNVYSMPFHVLNYKVIVIP